MPIRVDRRLLSTGLAEELRSYPVATAQVAAEAQQRQRELRQEIAQASRRP